MGPLAAAFVGNLSAGTHAPARLLSALIDTVFDPTWNVEHRLMIFAVIAGLLFLSGVGLPLPEDIPLTLAGFTAIKQAQDHFVFGYFAATFAIVAIPILLGDIIAYSLGSRLGLELRERFHILRRVLTDKRLARVQHWFDSYGAFTVFLGRLDRIPNGAARDE